MQGFDDKEYYMVNNTTYFLSRRITQDLCLIKILLGGYNANKKQETTIIVLMRYNGKK